MNRKSLVAVAAGLMLISGGSAVAQQKCQGLDIANGPFSYSVASPALGAFVGSSNAIYSPQFTVTAPSAQHDTAQADVFPGQGQDTCLIRAAAHIHIHEIVKVKDANGTPLNPPVNIDAASGLFDKISSAFVFAPPTAQFIPGQTISVSVTVSNPVVDPADLGSYVVAMKSHAPGAGIGVGPGATFTLDLNPGTPTDLIPPTVTINKPAGDQILGVIPVEISATDPAPGSGVASMSASISSTGGAVSNVALTLSVAGLPQGSGAAGTPVTATSSFTPLGGTGTAGTTMSQAFSSSNRSGIGNYLINARATDGAGNMGQASAIFKVKYALDFTQLMVPPGCPGGRDGTNFGSCHVMYQMKAKRSNITSDGAFMFDTTVVLKLVRTSDNVVVATHACNNSNCNGGAINSYVQIQESDKVYKTHFKHTDIDLDPNTPGTQAPTTVDEYRVDVFFMDVDGNLMFQGSSLPMTF